MKLNFSLLKENLVVCRLHSNHAIDLTWTADDFFSITKTHDELSVVISETVAASSKTLHGEDVKIERLWKGLKVEGPLDFSLIGIMANISSSLAAGGRYKYICNFYL